MITNTLKKCSILLLGGLLTFFALQAAPINTPTQGPAALQGADSLNLAKNHFACAADTPDLAITACYEDMEAVEIYRFMEEGPVFTQGYITRIGVITTGNCD